MMMDNLVLQLSGESNRSPSPNSGLSYPLIPLLCTPAESKAQSKRNSSGCDNTFNSDAEPSGCLTQPSSSLSALLCGVVAFVDVRTESDNRSRAIETVLKQLGADVSNKLTRDVTHVVFKDGKKRTLDLASKYGAVLVSVQWIVRCKETKTRVNETLFPVSSLQQCTPLPYGRLKRYRSMQPKSIEECEVDSEKKLKRRKKANKFQVFSTPEPVHPPEISSSFFVANTHKKRDYFDADRSDSDSSSSLTIPDTPLSLRKRVFSKFGNSPSVGTPNAAGTKINAGVSTSSDINIHQRNLFIESSRCGNALPYSTSEVCTISSVCISSKPSVMTSASSVSPEIPCMQLVQSNSTVRQLEKSASKSLSLGLTTGNLNKSSKRTSSIAKVIAEVGEKRPSSEPPVNPLVTLLPLSQMALPCSSQGCSTDKDNKCGRSDVSIKTIKANVVKSGERIELSEANDASGSTRRARRQTSSVRRESFGCHGQQGVHDNLLKKQVKGLHLRLSVSDKKRHGSDQRMETGSITTSTTKVSFGMKQLTPALNSDCKTRSNDKENDVFVKCLDSLVLETRVKGRKFVAADNGDCSPVPFCLSDDECDSGPAIGNVRNGVCELRRLPAAWEKQSDVTEIIGGKSVRLQNGNNKTKKKLELINEDSINCREKEVPRKQSVDFVANGNVEKAFFTVSMTSLHRDEQALVRETVQKLKGGFTVVDKVQDDTTHIICGSNRRTIKVLIGIAKGCWIVSLDWITESSANGKWLDEKCYEQSNFFPAAAVSREARFASPSVPYKPTLFSGVGDVFISEKSVPPYSDLKQLIILCGGQVTTRMHKSCLSVGWFTKKAKACVSEQWILDSVTKFCPLPFDDYSLKI